MFGCMLLHRALTHERVVTPRPDTVEVPQSGRSGRAAARAAPRPATVDVGAEELKAGGDADASVEVAVVSDECRPFDLDVVAAWADAVKVLAMPMDAASIRTQVGGGVPHETVGDRRRRPVDGGTRPDLFFGELVVSEVPDGRPASSLPRRSGAASARRPPTTVLVRFVMFEAREDWMRRRHYVVAVNLSTSDVTHIRTTYSAANQTFV